MNEAILTTILIFFPLLGSGADHYEIKFSSDLGIFWQFPQYLEYFSFHIFLVNGLVKDNISRYLFLLFECVDLSRILIQMTPTALQLSIHIVDEIVWVMSVIQTGYSYFKHSCARLN